MCYEANTSVEDSPTLNRASFASTLLTTSGSNCFSTLTFLGLRMIVSDEIRGRCYVIGTYGFLVHVSHRSWPQPSHFEIPSVKDF
jgi:hypothetical protein